MRIGNRLGVVVVVAMSAAMPRRLAAGADAAERVQPVPLGVALDEPDGRPALRRLCPDPFGGELTVKTTAGDRRTRSPAPTAASDANGAGGRHDQQQGWYTFTVTKADRTPYTVETTFVQVGQSSAEALELLLLADQGRRHPRALGRRQRPGRHDAALGDDVMVATPGGYIAPGQDIVRAGPNGLLETPVAAGDDSTWFPNLYDDLTCPGADGTMYQTPSPLLKYDQLFSSSARNWEAANSQNQDIQRWPGHCLGGAVASILLNEPIPAPGSGLTQDELKALWAELGENHYNHQIGDYANEIPAGPPRPGFDDTDRFVPRFHAMLETHIRGQKQALLGNLRAFPPRGTSTRSGTTGSASTPPRTTPIPGKGERAVRLEVELDANSGSSLNGQDDKPRIINYEYILVYGLDGKVDETQALHCRLDLVGGEAMFAPLNILEVVGTRWAGHNPNVTEANVRSLDLANGGGYGRFAGAPRRLSSPSTSTRPAGARSSPAELGLGDDWLAPPRRLLPLLRRLVGDTP